VDDAVRKTVTVLFCDLAGSTALEERVDAESSRDIIGRYHELIQQVIEGHGGSVAKFIGDGAMALFGVPEVAVDDAERAVDAGLELQRRFLPLGQQITDRFGADVGLRVGINTGEVVISDGDSDLVGDAVNTAARLESACDPGDVLVGEDTWRVTRSTVSFDDVGEIELKGKDAAVAAYRAIGVIGDDESVTPFVGREEELARLTSLFDEALAQRSVRLATVIGAPGVGKTRLARELERVVDGRATVIDLRCERVGATTFAPVADLLRSVADVDDATDADQTIAELRRIVADLDDADRVASLLGSFLGATGTRSTEELFFAVRRLIEALGRRHPTVLVVDDIQWAEPLFLDMLEHLAEWVQESPAILLALARPELREIRPSLAEPGRRVTETIALEGLDARATAELAARLVGTDSLPRDLLARLPESTEGNPLFVRELMKMLVDDNVIVETDGRWELAIDADAVEVPPTIQSLLSARIERMPDDERRLVELASVVGPDFPLGAVASISAPADAGRLMPTLERLRRKELVEPTGTYWGNEPVFRFHHVLIRDAAYRRLLKGTRADLHLRVATWIEEVGSNVVGEHEVTIGYHLEQAHEYRLQLDIAGDETAATGRRAAELLGTAARRALARDDVAAAGSLATRAIARLEPDADELPDLLMLGCEALFALGDVAAALPLLKQLEGRAPGDPRLTAWTTSFGAQLIVLTDPDRLEQAEADSASAAEELASLDDRAGEANARLVRAGALARLGHIGECEAELDLALTAARAAGDGRRVATVLGAAPVAALWGPSPVSRAGGRCLDVIRLLRITTGSPGVEATSTRC
jgi:class 3 adenylate cyclase/tetratricopeptide (TPR) repeat protein